MEIEEKLDGLIAYVKNQLLDLKTQIYTLTMRLKASSDSIEIATEKLEDCEIRTGDRSAECETE